MRRIQVFEGPGKGTAKARDKTRLFDEQKRQCGWRVMTSGDNDMRCGQRDRKSHRILKIMEASFSFIPNAMGHQGDQLDFKEIKPVNPKGS